MRNITISPTNIVFHVVGYKLWNENDIASYAECVVDITIVYCHRGDRNIIILIFDLIWYLNIYIHTYVILFLIDRVPTVVNNSKFYDYYCVTVT